MKKYIQRIIPFMLLVLVFSCTPDDNDAATITEFDKDISGSWHIVSIIRNGEDITNVINAVDFRVTFKEDHTYDFQNYIPFAVSEVGNWQLDDPKYPFNISFKSNIGEDVQIQMGYPIVDGKRHMELTFSPGCSKNKYVYTLEKVSE
ncbi:DUF5004 domain-containing protein [Zhouia sp. PK063]|uniref:DUF5004 domain-containing protein n=1 Tax=Zhouia sp. PK063 TaxID=3373602 RepID=UPI0037BA2C8A